MTRPKMNFLDYTEDELTWDLISNLKVEYDAQYDVFYKVRPMLQERDGWKTDGKPYYVHTKYWLSGNQLFIGSRRYDKGDPRDFVYKQLIDLTELDIMTKPKVRRRHRGWFLGCSWGGATIEVCGESFHEPRLEDNLPYKTSFTLRYPVGESEIEWKEMQGFLYRLKHIIYEHRFGISANQPS